jgi:hypothetical protein
LTAGPSHGMAHLAKQQPPWTVWWSQRHLFRQIGSQCASAALKV